MTCRRDQAVGGDGVRTCTHPRRITGTGCAAAPGYILFQLLRLIGRDVCAEEFNTLKTLELAILNDRIWAQVCAALGWKFLPTV